MTDNDFWSSYIPGRLPSVVPTWRPLPGTRKPLRLVEPDYGAYDQCFRGFRFWEIAPAEEEGLIDHPKLDQEPACAIRELGLLGAETKKRKLGAWLVWFSCQPADRKRRLSAKGRDLGQAYLNEVGAVNLSVETPPPRLPVRSGTTLLGSSPEEFKTVLKHWQQAELKWLAWYAAQGNFRSERTEAIAWNTAVPMFAAYGHTYPQRDVIKHAFQDRVVESEKDKAELNNLIEARGMRPRSLLSMISDRNSRDRCNQEKKAPTPLITISEFKAKSSEWIGSVRAES
ncbi:MAG: hypothetical protein ABJ388_00275 [Alphaproteobacteria bacterium]|uniref:hypothetical protein n=1 Tax=Roseibium sp. TaxID=1936156 RepID=UPI00327E7457